MSRLELQDFEFKEEDDKVKFIFMKYYYFLVDKSELKKIGDFKVKVDFLDFDASEKTMSNKINRILKIGLNNLFSVLGKRTIYIHKDAGIPLLGTNEFGLVDRNTNLIEVKPHTLCNLNCIYCSVDAGTSSSKIADFVVEEEFLVEEFRKIAALKENPVEASINPQGEPLMYSRIIDLVAGLKASEGVKTVSINTNGSLLTKKLIDDFWGAGLDRINISLNTVFNETANRLSGGGYPLEKVKQMIKYCSGKIDVLIAPLIVPDYNDTEVRDLLKFCLKLEKVPKFGFQNFLNYQRGRNPIKEKPMDDFMKLLEDLEKVFSIKLINSPDDFNIVDDTKIPKPFKKGQIVDAKIMCPGKYPKEFIGVSRDRCLTISGNMKIGSFVKVKIVRIKHNIFRAI
ncbi:radical SAM protein [archaeon]|nr:radical SAM protein [archaeon]MBL7057410.1 radical SAM protein [Candidatus Woesearchaeota archaeon]